MPGHGSNNTPTPALLQEVLAFGWLLCGRRHDFIFFCDVALRLPGSTASRNVCILPCCYVACAPLGLKAQKHGQHAKHRCERETLALAALVEKVQVRHWMPNKFAQAISERS